MLDIGEMIRVLKSNWSWGGYMSSQGAIDAAVKAHEKWLNGEPDGERLRLYFEIIGDKNFSNSNLSHASFIGVNLEGANFSNCILHDVDFSEANLMYADFENADLIDVDFSDASLEGADFNMAMYDIGVESQLAKLKICPEEGSFIGWKKVRQNGEDYIVKLLIPEDAERSNASGRKCRCSYAIVLDIDPMPYDHKVVSPKFGPRKETIYELGKAVYPDLYDYNRWHECSHGIHFFITRAEAENYMI